MKIMTGRCTRKRATSAFKLEQRVDQIYPEYSTED
jgi:hypothetical protein